MKPSSRLTLHIQPLTGRSAVPFLRRNLLSAWDLLRPPLRELSVALVGDARMSRLHEQFMGIAKPTDVLTFPLDDPDSRGRSTAGEVVICVPEARRQSARSGIPLRHELLLYALHGMLHLCGFDDRTDAAFKKMHRKEDEILTKLGVGMVFQRPAAPARSRRRTGARR